MTRAQERRFRKLLQQRRAELLGGIKARQDVLQVEYLGDPIDRVRQVAERELAVRNLERVSAMLKSVEGALKEIEEGTFGVCASCGKPIPVKRLEVVPWSPYCVQCQARTEHTEQREDRAGSELYNGPAGEDVVDLRRLLVA